MPYIYVKDDVEWDEVDFEMPEEDRPADPREDSVRPQNETKR